MSCFQIRSPVENSFHGRDQLNTNKVYRNARPLYSQLSPCEQLANTGRFPFRKKNPEISVGAKVEFPTGKKLFHLVVNPGSSLCPTVAAWNWYKLLETGNTSVKSKFQLPPPPRATPRALDFSLRIIVQIPSYPGQNAVQMPHTRVHSGDQMPPPWRHFTGT